MDLYREEILDHYKHPHHFGALEKPDLCFHDANPFCGDEIIGKSVDELKGWQKEQVLDLLGIEVGPVRMKCALLPLKALKAAVWGLAEDSETA